MGRLHVRRAPQIARDCKGSYAVMDLTGPSPVLRLNKNIKGFEALLGSTKAHSSDDASRDTIGTGIARYALGDPLPRGVRAIDVDAAGAADSPEDPLFRQVLEAVAGQIERGLPEEFYERVPRRRS